MSKVDKFKRACAVVILHDGGDGIILGYSYKYNDWELPGGKHEIGETSQEAAARECKEECGIEPLLPLEFVCNTESKRSLAVNYAKKISRHVKPEVREPKKHREWRWFSITDLPTPLRPECTEVIEEWLKRKE